MRSSRGDAAGDIESGGVPGAAPDGSGKFRSGSRTYGSVPPQGAEPASEERESTLGYIFRVSEPIVFWTACTLIAAFSCLGMIRITRFPHFPATLPEGHDGRTMQVGYVANSTGALESYVGCAPTRGGENLRDDIGTDRFPDFVIAGARGAPVDALHRLLREKHVACSAENVDDDLFGAPRYRAAPIPLDEQRRWVESNYHRCGEEERFLGVPRFQTSRDLLYRGWAPERMCEAMGSEETRAVILLPDPINHALAVFSEVLAPHKSRFARWYRRAAEEPSAAEEASATTTPSSESGNATSSLGASGPRPAGDRDGVTYNIRGFETTVAVDLAVAEACGPGAMLSASDADYDANRECCRAAAAALGWISWPGCGDCHPDLEERERKACERDGELAFSPARAGAYAEQLRRFYRRVPARNVMVVTADQALESGIPALAVAVVEWRLFGLPLVDPVSVTTDLMMSQARVTAAAMARAATAADSAAGTGAFESRRESSGSSGSSGLSSGSSGSSGLSSGSSGSGAGAGSGSRARPGAAAPSDAVPSVGLRPFARGGGGLASLRSLERRAGGDDGVGLFDDVSEFFRRVSRFFRDVFSSLGARGFDGWGWGGTGRRHTVRRADERVVDEAAASKPERAAMGRFSVVADPAFGDATIPDALRRRLVRFYDPLVDDLNALLGNGETRWWDADGAPTPALQRETLVAKPPSPPPFGWTTEELDDVAEYRDETENRNGNQDGDGEGVGFVVDAANFASGGEGGGDAEGAGRTTATATRGDRR